MNEQTVVYQTDNLRTWCEAMWSGEYRQGTGKLAHKGESGTVHYCCLGLGSVLAGLTPRFMIGDEEAGAPTVEVGYGTGMFGPLNVYSLAPVEFVQWLGFEGDEGSREYDLWLDLPWRLPLQGEDDQHGAGMDRHIQDWLNDGEGRQARDFPYFAYHVTTLAGLNDDGFTFAQIADLTWYFGVRITEPTTPEETYWVQ